jgi:hypothetical protein
MRMFSLVGRLRSEMTLNQARTVLKIVGRHLSDTYPKLLEGMTMDVQPEALGRIPLGIPPSSARAKSVFAWRWAGPGASGGSR